MRTDGFEFYYLSGDAVTSFMEKMLRSYVEPERKGTPKGEPIGFMKPKYGAALACALTPYTLQYIADLCGVSHGLLRKWRTEETFKTLVDSIKTDFRKYLLA